MPAWVIGGASLLSGYLGSKAAKGAAGESASASKAAIDEQARQFDIGQQNLAPYMFYGSNALAELASRMGLPAYDIGVPAYNQPVNQLVNQPGTMVTQPLLPSPNKEPWTPPQGMDKVSQMQAPLNVLTTNKNNDTWRPPQGMDKVSQIRAPLNKKTTADKNAPPAQAIQQPRPIQQAQPTQPVNRLATRSVAPSNVASPTNALAGTGAVAARDFAPKDRSAYIPGGNVSAPSKDFLTGNVGRPSPAGGVARPQDTGGDTLPTFSYSGQIPQFSYNETLPSFQGGVRFQYNLEADPGYQFAKQEALNAATRQAAKQGKYGSGNLLTDLQNRASGLASQYANDVFNRQLASSQTNYGRDVGEYGMDYQRAGDLYNRALTSYDIARGNEATQYGRDIGQYGLDYNRATDIYGRGQNELNWLANIAGIGQNTTLAQNQAGQNTANIIGNIQMANAANQGSALTNKYGAINNAVQGGIGNWLALQNQNMWQNYLNQ